MKKKVKCPYCSRKFENSTDKDVHVQNRHPKEGRK